MAQYGSSDSGASLGDILGAAMEAKKDTSAKPEKAEKPEETEKGSDEGTDEA